MDGAVSTPAAQAKKEKAIASYEEFKPVALEVYDQLNRDYNLDELGADLSNSAEIGDRVSRSHFNEWLLEMQATTFFS
jgi:hypothetical protein